jgi:hypothetical protein
VLTLLTKYLLRYRKVCIPNVGTFEIVLQSSQLNVADKCISSPVYITKHRKEEIVPDHQFHFFTNEGMQKDSFMQDFFLFGERMKRRIQNSPFYWKGFGTLRRTSETIIFVPAPIDIYSLKPVTADKVMRGTSEHNMLVGDKEMTFQEATDVLQQPAEIKRTYPLWIGWVLLALAVIAIIIILYQGDFQPAASGMKGF